MDKVNIAIELFSIITTVLLLICSIAKREKTKLNLLFTMMLVMNIIVLSCDLVTWIYSGKSEYDTVLYICNFFVYSIGYVIVALFNLYLYEIISVNSVKYKRCLKAIIILCIVAIGLVIVSLFNHMYFYFEGGEYFRGPLFWLSQAYSVIIIFVDVIIILYYRKQVGWSISLSLMSYCFMPVVAMLVQIVFYGITLLYVATTFSMMIIYITIQIQQSRRLKQKELELTQAKISIMLSQIQPHFLYNALCVIQDLCHDKAPEAEEATIEFSRFLRGNLDSLSATSPIPFEQELSHTRNYLYLEKKRFKKRLNVEYHIETTDFGIPALTLQPIVENAVRYGVMKKEEGGTVWISTGSDENYNIVTVRDDGMGFDIMEKKEDGRTHIGISNVRGRIESMCNGTMEITSVRGKGTFVIIRIPKGEKR